MAKKDKKSKSKKESNQEEVVEATPTTSSSEELNDEFDKLLQSFIDSELSDDNPKPSGDGSEQGDIWFSDIKFATTVEGEELDPIPSQATQFVINKDKFLVYWVDVEGQMPSAKKYKSELYDADNDLLAWGDPEYRVGENCYDIFCLAAVSSTGDYYLRISNGDKEIYSKKLRFVMEEDYNKDALELTGFGIYRINNGDRDNSTIMERGKMNCYDYENLEGVLVASVFKNITEARLPYQLVLSVKNESGKEVYESVGGGFLDADEEFVFSRDVRAVVCPTGAYTVTIKYIGEVILSTEFVVAQRDIRAEFKTSSLQGDRGKAVTEIKKETNPLEELDSMIGLDGVKTQVRKLIAKINLDKLRKAQGLPVKPQQLHMAFLGNPGTGKTTVAKLLGQIYKEIGVLSKGHVVVEGRSTLMTTSWGGEGEMVNKALGKSQGGILFIDEAYDLITEHKDDPGRLIISALLEAMSDENNRDFMVIFAGYTMPMERLLSKNPGLRSRLTSMYFDDFNDTELMQVADRWLGKNCYTLTADARNYFESVLAVAYAMRNENFGNARYVINLLENQVQPAMAERVVAQDTSVASLALLTTIEACDIPNYKSDTSAASDAIARLDNMVGLDTLKSQIRNHLSYIRFVQARRENKISTPIPPLHMIFTGNPGTGKTSVSEYLGRIYRSMGLLSLGNVIKVSRADMIGQYVGDTETKMKNLLTAAHGNILFIDEAYTLFSERGNDYGKIAVEMLLDALGKENSDMIVVMAGYPKEMEELLSINPGLKGRFPYVFHFEDYDQDELFEIATGVVERNGLKLTDGAAEAIKAVIRKECKIKDSNFSNARFVVRLITTQVLPNMAARLEGETDPNKLRLVYQRDIPIEHKEIRMINENLFDEQMIASALERLDAMVGLTKVKVAIHQFVDFARVINHKDPTQIERYPLKWSFVGNTGTGKSSVAEVLSEILKAMHLIGKGHTVEVKAEELYGVATHKADELLQQRMRDSLQGLLFVDGDAPQFRASNSSFNPDYLRMCLAVNTAEIHGRFAVVIAEQDSPAIGLAKSLNSIGISNFNHTLIFDDYTAEELVEILSLQLSKYSLSLSDGAAVVMYGYIKRLCSDNQSEANARTMKELARVVRNLAVDGGSTISEQMVANFTTLQPSRPNRKLGY